LSIERVCLVGGAGFVGSHVAYRLATSGHKCLVLTRHSQRHRDLAVNDGIDLVECDIFDSDALMRQLRDCDAAINLVGILNESGTANFRRVHVDLVENLMAACRATGIRRFLHMSALHADAGNGTSEYLRSKGEGENLAHARGQPDIAVTSFRPSVIFGRDDSFINRFATLLRLPGPMPLACPDAKFAPVCIDDVAKGFVDSLERSDTYGQRYDLCGPQVYTLEEIVQYIARQLGRRKSIVRLPDRVSRWQARVLELVPGKPFTRDNYLSLQIPSICKDNGLELLGIKPTPMDAVVPQFLCDDTPRGKFYAYRKARP
jgi:NADH dehydrogenase